MNLHTGCFATPLGRMRAEVDDEGRLWSLVFDDSRGAKATSPALERVKRELDEYFAKKRTKFELALAERGTPFQRKVWKSLAKIPFGETISYAELAKRVGKPGAVRAVGAANGANPWSIVVPCHRVVGSDGSLTGYSGGVDKKRALLDLEGVRSLSRSSLLR